MATAQCGLLITRYKYLKTIYRLRMLFYRLFKKENYNLLTIPLIQASNANISAKCVSSSSVIVSCSYFKENVTNVSAVTWWDAQVHCKLQDIQETVGDRLQTVLEHQHWKVGVVTQTRSLKHFQVSELG